MFKKKLVRIAIVLLVVATVGIGASSTDRSGNGFSGILRILVPSEEYANWQVWRAHIEARLSSELDTNIRILLDQADMSELPADRIGILNHALYEQMLGTDLAFLPRRWAEQFSAMYILADPLTRKSPEDPSTYSNSCLPSLSYEDELQGWLRPDGIAIVFPKSADEEILELGKLIMRFPPARTDVSYPSFVEFVDQNGRPVDSFAPNQTLFIRVIDPSYDDENLGDVILGADGSRLELVYSGTSGVFTTQTFSSAAQSSITVWYRDPETYDDLSCATITVRDSI